MLCSFFLILYRPLRQELENQVNYINTTTPFSSGHDYIIKILSLPFIR